MRRRRVALVHDWLTGMRGGEKVLELFCELFPDAPIFTLLHVPGSVSATIRRHPIRTSGLQHLPWADRLYRWYLPLMPWAVRDLNLSGFDAVFSVSTCVAKSVIVPPGVPHVCYINTPMRYVWDQFPQYFPADRWPRWRRRPIEALAAWLRWWDRRTADRVTHFVANSENVRQRVRRAYGREAEVIYPPVDTTFYHPTGRSAGDYFLCVGALAPYKRLDLAVEAFNRLRLPLVVIGRGPEEKRLRARAGRTILFAGWQPAEALREHYSACRALVFPGEEDFGIVPLEAMACGRPVIAYGRGGVLETAVPLRVDGDDDPPPTAVFFHDPSADALIEAIQTFVRHANRFQPSALRRQALRFDVSVCRRHLQRLCRQWVDGHAETA